MRSNTLVCAVALTLSAALAGCAASKTGPFADVTARDQEQPSDAQPTTRPVEAPDKPMATRPAPTISVSATPAAAFAKDPSDSVPATVVVTDTARPPTNPPATAPAAAPMGKLVVHVDEHGRLSRDFAPSTFERPSGDVLAGPVYWPNKNRTIKRGDAENFVFEPMEFIVDSLLMPIRACITPPWTDVVYDPVPQDNTTPASVTDRQPVTQERVLKK
ncbi:MAG: hypothetical protein ACHRHE_21230 [Tepidisphaerales bacterium]